MNATLTPKQIESNKAKNNIKRKTEYAVRKQRRQRIADVVELTAYAVNRLTPQAAKKVHLFKAHYCRLECTSCIGFESLRQSNFNH